MLMATSGFFTYYDLYGGKPENYHYQHNSQLSSFREIKLLSISNTTIISIPTITSSIELVSLTTIQSNNKLYKLIQLVPFTYLHWFLIGLAILLTLLLIIIFISYCHNYCRKNNKLRNKKKQSSSSNIYRYRKSNKSFHTYNIYETATPRPFPSPTRSCSLNSTEHLNNNQLFQQDLDTIGSPRIDISQTRLSHTFSNTASDLLTEIKKRFSIRSSEISLKTNE
ncbi:unnamed protein product [Rotaria sordida]|uniref:Uncharacterized protein n=1 Tax=Rotaria sordida TaxID=392033 RepID=A0A814BXA4_9BILA|nr:unnamed protein product [Rotaria sordida]CAF1123357.1 unnamed protein product [Rotaria sordida]CAF3588168.1 unnamed protein product [Rotaria sordida]CAF3636225.1 unnamed protein product [Rotaria sordida]